MSLKLRQFYLKFLKINLPFSSKKFIGEDLKGNYYYEESFSDGYPRRTVKILDSSVKSDLSSLASAPLPGNNIYYGKKESFINEFFKFNGLVGCVILDITLLQLK
jgi:hypothetical protein